MYLPLLGVLAGIMLVDSWESPLYQVSIRPSILNEKIFYFAFPLSAQTLFGVPGLVSEGVCSYFLLSVSQSSRHGHLHKLTND